MAGAIIERQLTHTRTARVSFGIADQNDDASIRRLLRETPMNGQVSISLEREPNYFADAAIAGETRQTIVAYDNGRLACVGSCAIRDRFVNGQPRRVGYLGSLRMDHEFAGRFDILRRGYEFFRELQTEAPADFYFTSIAADNERARRFLERGVSGMPLYEFIGEFATVLISTHREAAGRETNCDAVSADQLLTLLNTSNQKHQFTPCWSAAELDSLKWLGLQVSDFRTVRGKGETLACGAIWDQRSFKQTVIRGYAPWLKMARPFVNGINRLTNGPRLPKAGETLAHAFASHIAFASNASTEFTALMRLLLRAAHERGLELLTFGFAAGDPNLAFVLKEFSCREYRSRLYVVRWPGIGRSAAELDDRNVAPDVALL